MKSFRSAILLALLVGLCIGGAAPARAGSGTPEDPWIIGMSQCNLAEPWRAQMNKDIADAAAAHPEVRAIFKDAQNDTLVQRQHIEEFVNQGVDVLLVSPKEAVPLTEPVARAYQAGIPVMVLDRRIMGDQYTTFIGADNKLIGQAVGRWIARQTGGTGNIVELKGLMTSTPGQDRHSGFLKGIEGTDLKVIFEADMEWLEPKARQEMESALARFPDIDVVYGHNDPAAHGAYLAARAAGRADEMIFVGIDALPHEGKRYVEEGILDASFEYPTGGREAIATAVEILLGKEAPKEIVLPSRFFTADNVKDNGLWLEEAGLIDMPGEEPSNLEPNQPVIEERLRIGEEVGEDIKELPTD
ncbi:MAG TPA: substrate-binding domain-containing protein [Candidatus Sumerlaeota bacterium]|nr:substrate-binding domain-containing protein [Candidatus Sumerlaeota bacterium]HPK01246.1 substrate-binding domain-containing protein [Candidatus Sumerlaeota bacterium]